MAGSATMSGFAAKKHKCLLAFVVLATMVAGLPSVAAGADGTVVINELHYHPEFDPDEDNDLDDNEFLELHNPGDSPVDLAGYTFGPAGDPAIKLTEPLSGTLAPGAFAILAPDGADTQARWGVAPIGTYTGKLSNGGELIELIAGSGAVVDSVEWDDSAPWPGTPDGDGPSLELIDPSSNNSVASNWLASSDGPTPGATNSAATAPDTRITDVVAAPQRPAPNQQITVTATGAADSLNLVYVVGFGAEQTISMSRNGTTFGATIPGQAAGELVRYRITDPASDASAPDGNDGRRWLGVVVDDPSVATGMDLVEWFIPEVDYNAMFDNPLEEIYANGSVMVINGEVFDNIDIKIRGGNYSRENSDKLALSVDLPSGVTLDDPNLVPYPVDEFALGNELGWTYGRQHAGWSLYEDAGFPTVNAQHVRVQRNGEFYGIYRLSEKLDNRWREAAGITGDFYKGAGGGFHTPTGFEKKQPDDDLSPIISLADVLNSPSSNQKTEYLYDEIDIPNVVNFLAVSFIVGHYDTWDQNYYMHEDTERTEQWQVYPWDLSDTYGVGACDEGAFDFGCINNPLWNSVLEVPELEQMVYRRIRSLLDGPMARPETDALIADFYPTVSPAEMVLDTATWSYVDTYFTESMVNDEIDARRAIFENHDQVPNSQSDRPAIVINEIQYSPAGDGVEYVELYNPTSQSVDLSGWNVDGIGLTIDEGTVIMPRGYVVLTESIPDFHVNYPSAARTVLVQFDGGLKKGGERVTLSTADDVVIDSVNYRLTGDWPLGPDGNGPSLELVNPQSDNSLGINWASSSVSGGTPGTANRPTTDASEPRTPTPDRPAEDQIVRLYQAIFGRTPDAAGLAFWLDRYQTGSSLAEITAAMAESSEFTSRYGTNPSNAELVDALYQNVLGRAGDSEGRAYWISNLDAGSLSTIDVIMAFSDSPENINRTETSPPLSALQSQVLRLYQAIFDRPPDEEGFQFWAGQLSTGQTLPDMAAAFVSSPEFEDRYGPSLSDAQFVDALYLNVLSRGGEPDGRAFWIDQLETGTMTRVEVLVAFSESSENVIRTGTAP